MPHKKADTKSRLIKKGYSKAMAKNALEQCQPPEKPTNPPMKSHRGECDKTKTYQTPAEQRLHLEKEVIPIVMQGMLELAREQPRDPISYLEKFWLQKQHKCDIKIPDDLL